MARTLTTAISKPFDRPEIRAAIGRTRHFFSWWADELAGALPERWRGYLRAHRALWLRSDERGWVMEKFDEGERQPVLEIQRDSDLRLVQQEVQEVLQQEELRNLRRICFVPADEVLVRRIRLPKATEGNLDQALSFEMDRQTPFRASDVYFDYRVVERHPETGQIEVEMAVIPRARLDALREAMDQRGIALHQMDVGPVPEGRASNGFNLLPVAARAPLRNERSRLNGMLAGATAALLLAAMLGSLWLHGWRVDRLEAVKEEVQVEARAVNAMKREYEERLAASKFLTERRAQVPPLTQIIADITTALPDDTYLQSMRLDDTELMLYGYTDGAEKLLERLNNMEHLADASFAGQTQMDRRRNKEQFTLRARVTEGG